MRLSSGSEVHTAGPGPLPSPLLPRPGPSPSVMQLLEEESRQITPLGGSSSDPVRANRKKKTPQIPISTAFTIENV